MAEYIPNTFLLWKASEKTYSKILEDIMCKLAQTMGSSKLFNAKSALLFPFNNNQFLLNNCTKEYEIPLAIIAAHSATGNLTEWLGPRIQYSLAFMEQEQ